MSEPVGYRLVDDQGNIVSSWGGIWGRCPGMPNPIQLPNGDQVHSPALDEDYAGCKLVGWYLSEEEETAAAWSALRSARDRLLTASDWVRLRALDTGTSVPDEWAAYRQALRDLPEITDDPRTAEWPDPPAE
jgi:hypothetical protein